MARMTGGQAIVKTLVRHGIDTVFGLPGVQTDNVFDALYEARNQIRVLHTRHEQGAAYMAMGYAQATGKVGTFFCVPGPGILNATAALCTAQGSNAPVLGITAHIPSYQIGLGLGIPHEILDQEKALRGVVPWVGRADKPEEAPSLLREAFRRMMGGRPQPVVFEMPPDIMGQNGDVELLEPETSYKEPALDERGLEAAARLLGDAKKPAIFVGSGIFGAETELLQLAELLEAPVIMSRTGRGAVSDRHYLGQGMIEGQTIWTDVDVALVVGTRFLSPALAWGREKEVKIIRIDIDEAQAKKPSAAEICIIARAKTALVDLVQRMGKQSRKRPSRKDELLAVKKDAQTRLATLMPQAAFGAVIREELPEDGFIVTDVTQMATFVQNALPIYQPRTMVTPGFQATLGLALPTALGVKVAHPDRKVISISGDGGFMFTVQELATAIAHNIAVVAIVFNDGAFGNVKRIQKDAYGGRNIAVELSNPDFPKMAESFGMLGLRARTPEELRQAIRQAFASNGPALIEVPVGELPNIFKLIQRPPTAGVARG